MTSEELWKEWRSMEIEEQRLFAEKFCRMYHVILCRELFDMHKCKMVRKNDGLRESV